MKAEAGRLGGLANVRNNGTEHMRKIGQRGGMKMHELYEIKPVGINDFCFIHRETGEVLPKLLSGKPAGWTPWHQ